MLCPGASQIYYGDETSRLLVHEQAQADAVLRTEMNWDELDKNILFGKMVAGVTAGASTPNWVIEEFVKHLEGFGDNQ